ncbi:MAG: HAD family hydrolase [Microcella sp.]|nr:MAG: HAD family hydrolase [Microcella sp.]
MLFDLDDTLMAHTAAVETAIDRARVRSGDAGPWHAVAFAAADPEAVRQRWHELEDEHYHRYLAGELDYLGQRVARARDLYAEHGVTLDETAALAWFDDYLHGYREAWALFDDVLPALDAIEQAVAGIRFGIITNGDLAFQTDKLHRIGLWNRLDLTPVRADGSIDDPTRGGLVIASGEIGVTKPDTRIFAVAAASLDLPLESCAYVGDRVRTDAVGAHEVGMLGIWLDRGAARNAVTDAAEGAAAELPAGVPRITSLLDLPALLAH